MSSLMQVTNLHPRSMALVSPETTQSNPDGCYKPLSTITKGKQADKQSKTLPEDNNAHRNMQQI
eukprot:15273262-Ditylum_brightwellii.AAC.1